MTTAWDLGWRPVPRLDLVEYLAKQKQRHQKNTIVPHTIRMRVPEE